jgi:hypothetical protein
MKSEMENLPVGDFEAINWWRPKKPEAVGQTTRSTIRLLPHWSGDLRAHWWLKVIRHYCMVMTNDGKKRCPRICAKRMAPKEAPEPCAICDRAEQAEAVGDKAMAKALKVQGRFYLNVFDAEDQQSHFVINQKTGDQELKAKVWDAGSSIYRCLYNLVAGKGAIFDLMMGRYITVCATKTGPKDLDIRYDCLDSSEPCPLPSGYEHIKLNNLEEVLRPGDYHDVAASIAETYPGGNFQQQGQTGYPPQGQQGQTGYPPQGQHPPQGQQGQTGYPPQGQQGQTGYPPQGQQGQTGYPPQGQSPQGQPPQGQPGYQAQGQPNAYAEPPYSNPYNQQTEQGGQGPPQDNGLPSTDDDIPF